ncbi:hypothetical protein P563_02208 [Staphylococcus aureus M1423]|jgi:hypothetical protein|uniref:Apea-like HEPN domain-containing protein n=5 Tax=Staphylococcus aureus TaxID=1280 RepID=A0A3A5M7K7_STAAU|nr:MULTISPECIES: hypothetical protein [Staphylococcus]EGL94374.1 hypothetical protein SA21318_2653 [Staphylococcus aureus subsp. aureus 21318]ENK63097.1 hypothetical protein UII_02166 [Staphylococcus aureus M0562]EUY48357.1 hypothetical protein O503_02096 [Staphylococcus aureus M0406]HAR4217206.1 hypothetical protein [Staphylococcus aureus ADL-227]HAR4239338.1 hypothetical protein [Staphylococcus aureus ADL-330]HDH6183208.1 hypothetical protein [Staphylococcus aureus LTCF-17-69]HDH6186541.1 
MKKSIYILPLAYIVIESPLQIGNVILTPSLKVIESGHFHTDFSLISMFNKKEFLSILSTSQLKEDALVIFKDDFFEPTTVDQNYYFINKLSQKADRTLDIIRINENNFGVPEQLPGIPGITSNGWQVAEQLTDHKLRTINGKVMFMIREGIGLYPIDLSSNIYEDKLYNCLYVTSNEINLLFREAIHRVSESMYMNNLNTSFVYLLSTLEMLSSREYLNFKKTKSKILPFISYSKYQYHKCSEYLRNISENLRTEIIHNGKSIFDLYDNYEDVYKLLNWIKLIIIEYISNIVKKNIQTFDDLEKERKKIINSLGI